MIKRLDDRRFLEELQARFRAGERPEFFHFWGHTPDPRLPRGQVDKSVLSQWHATSFEVDGRTFLTAEHYMMYSKAALFGDEEIKDRVFEVRDPKDVKALGRAVKGFDEAVWMESRYGIVVKGNIAKFYQNPQAQDFLLSTGEKILVEASPYDGVWGIKLAATDPRANDPTQWRGPNLLGFALGDARQVLRIALSKESKKQKQADQDADGVPETAQKQGRALGFRRFSRP